MKSKIIFKKTTDRFNYDAFIRDLSKFLQIYVKNENDVLTLTESAKTIVPFKMRQQKLAYPNNKCICKINYKKENVCLIFISNIPIIFNSIFQFQINEGDQCQIDDNSQKNNWKIVNKSNDVSIVPSVCFILDTIDMDSLDVSQKYNFFLLLYFKA